MTDALVEINDRLARAVRAEGGAAVTFFCECGECLADEVPLSLDEYEEIRVREDLIFAPGHDAPRRYPAKRQALDSSDRRDLLAMSRSRVAGRLVV
jgi:hypothetical protein